MPIFLIAPLAAVGVLLLKVVVAAGYLVTGQWAARPPDGEPGTVVDIAEPAGDPRVSDRFEDIVDRRMRDPHSGMVQPPRQRRRSPSRPLAVVELADAGGARIRCAFFAERAGGATGLCTDDHGRWLDLARVEPTSDAG